MAALATLLRYFIYNIMFIKVNYAQWQWRVKMRK